MHPIQPLMTAFLTAFTIITCLIITACDQGNRSPESGEESTPDTNNTQVTYATQGKTSSQNKGDELTGQTSSQDRHIADNGSADIEQIPADQTYRTVEWTDLMPAEDLEALLNPPSYITDIEEGSIEDQLSNQFQSAIEAATDDRYQAALVSKTIVPAFNNQAVRVPGFIVPLEFNDDQTITEFFLVPFFGACIHVPPPPPNQIIFVKAPQGIQLEALYDPFWISGKLETTLIENDIATAAYSMTMHSYELYSE